MEVIVEQPLALPRSAKHLFVAHFKFNIYLIYYMLYLPKFHKTKKKGYTKKKNQVFFPQFVGKVVLLDLIESKLKKSEIGI